MGAIETIRLGQGAERKPILIGGADLVIIAGPCVIESEDQARQIAEGLAESCENAGLPFVFKASFDKANRTSIDGFRGPGIEAGLEILYRIRTDLKLAVTTDIHQPAHAAQTAQTVDLLQIPAFLCRQTDLLVAAGETGCPVNIKKGQFLAPWDMVHAVNKVRSVGESPVMVTERGTSFGYNNLVVDMRSMAHLRDFGTPVCFDATHSAQAPGGLGESTGGERRMAPLLARSAVAAGVDAVFMEVHADPARALSDAAVQLALVDVPDLLTQLSQIHSLRSGSSAV